MTTRDNMAAQMLSLCKSCAVADLVSTSSKDKLIFKMYFLRSKQVDFEINGLWRLAALIY